MWRRVAVVVFVVLGWAGAVGAQEVNRWTNRGGTLQVPRGWLEWKQNDVDGRFCIFSGQSGPSNDVLCYDAVTNVWEEVYVGNGIKDDPLVPSSGDLHGWGWDPVARKYYVFDGKFRYQQFAFDYASRTFAPLTNADFSGNPGIEEHTRVSGAGTATSPDHGIMIIVQGTVNGGTTLKVRFLDLVNRTYTETTQGVPPSRQYIQNHVMYIPPLRSFLLFGGRGPVPPQGQQDLNDTWLYDLDRRMWIPVATSNPPPGTSNAHMAYDSVQNIVYLAGGSGITGPNVWILRLSNWTWEQLPVPAGTATVDYPGRRKHGTAMFHPDAGFCTVAGLMDGAANWQKNLETWCFKHTVSTDTTPPSPPAQVAFGSAPTGLVDLTVTWDKSSNDPADVAHYEVQRSQDGGNTWTGTVQVPANGSASYSFTYQGVVDGPARVRAVDSTGNPSPFAP